jgi:hypothetical protein
MAPKVVAETQPLPSSTAAPHGQPWTKMRKNSFPSTLGAVMKQCERTEKISEADSLTLEKCMLFVAMLADGQQCRTVAVPDGTVFDYMNYRSNGRSSVQETVIKKLGDNVTPAILCDLGDHVYAYYFTGENGCQNVAFVLSPQPETIPAKWMCRRETYTSSPSEFDMFLPGVLLPHCNCGQYSFAPGVFFTWSDNLQSNSQGEICGWQPG